jgi:hypothetical protein
MAGLTGDDVDDRLAASTPGAGGATGIELNGQPLS